MNDKNADASGLALELQSFDLENLEIEDIRELGIHANAAWILAISCNSCSGSGSFCSSCSS